MTDMNLDDRTASRRRGWSRLSRIVSGSLAVAAVGSAVYLGATGPLVSPVQPPAVAAAVTPVPAADDGRSAPGVDGRPDGGRGARDTGFDRGRRR
jgi:hypothetical protein